MLEQCTYDNTKCLWFNKTLYHFQFFPLSSCQYHSKTFTLKSFSFKVIYWFLAFESLSLYSEYFTFQKFLYFLCCYLHAFIIRIPFHPKSFYWFLAFKRFLSISNLLHSRNSFTLHAFILRSYLLVSCSFTCLYNWTFIHAI